MRFASASKCAKVKHKMMLHNQPQSNGDVHTYWKYIFYARIWWQRNHNRAEATTTELVDLYIITFWWTKTKTFYSRTLFFFFIPARMNEKNPANSCSPIFRLTINLLDQKCWWVCVGCKIEWISILYSAGITFYAIMRTQRIHNSKRAVSRIPSRRCVVAVY